jgi:hypothetical protein
MFCPVPNMPVLAISSQLEKSNIDSVFRYLLPRNSTSRGLLVRVAHCTSKARTKHQYIVDKDIDFYLQEC